MDEYLATIPEPARSTLEKVRTAIRSAVPDEASETISYGMPAFPTASVIEEFQEELRQYHTSKGTIHFPIDKPLPVALVKKLVKARVAYIKNKKCD